MFTKPKIFFNNILRDAQTGDDGTDYATCPEAIADPANPNKLYGVVAARADVASLASLKGSGLVFDTTQNAYHVTDIAAAVGTMSSLGLLPPAVYIYAAVVVDSYLYAASYSPGVIWKIDLSTPSPSVVDYCRLSDNEEYVRALVYDAATNCLYAGCYLAPGKIAKVSLDPFERVDGLTLAANEDNITSLAVYSGMLYAGCLTAPGKIARIDLSTFVQSGTTVALAAGEDSIQALVNSGSFLYAGCGVSPGKICRVDLVTFTQSGATVTGAAGENDVAALATDGTYVYAGFNTVAGMVLRIATSTFTKTGATLTFAAGENQVRALAVSGTYLYCGLNTAAGKVVRVDTAGWAVSGATVTLGAGENYVYSLTTDGTYVYCGHYLIPAKISRIIISTFLQDGTTLALTAGEIGINAMVVSGTYAYCGLNTSPGKIVRVNLNSMQPEGDTITLATGENVVKDVALSGTYLYCGLGTSPGKIVRVDISTWALSGATITLAAGENIVNCLAISGSYLYGGLETAAGKVIRINITTWALSGATISLGAEPWTRALAVSAGYLYCGMGNNPASVVRINTGTWAIDGAVLAFAVGETFTRSLLVSGNYLYVGIDTTPGKVSRINITTWAITGPTLTFGAGEGSVKRFAALGDYLYCGAQKDLIRIKISTWAIYGSTVDVGGDFSGGYIYGIHVTNTYIYCGLLNASIYYPGIVVRLGYSYFETVTLFERLQDADIGDGFTIRAGLTCAQTSAMRPVLYAADGSRAPRFTGIENTALYVRAYAPNFCQNGGFESGVFLPEWTAEAGWSVISSAAKLEGAYSASWDLVASKYFMQSMTGKLVKGRTYTILFKAQSTTANPTAGAIIVTAKQSGSNTDIDSDQTGYQPAITTAAAWFSFDVTADFTTDDWYLKISGDHTKANGATAVVIDELYIYEKKTVNSLILGYHNLIGKTVTVNAWRLSPLRSTSAVDANNKAIIGNAITVDTADVFLATLTTIAYPVIEIYIPATAGFTPEIGEAYVGDYWQLPNFLKGPLDPYRTNADGLIEQTWAVTNMNPALRTTTVEALFEKLRASEAIWCQWDTDAPILMEVPREAWEAPYNPFRTDMTLKPLEKL